MSRAESGNAPQSTGSQLKEKASEMASSLRDMGGNVTEAVSEKYDQIKNAASEKYDQLKNNAVEYYEAGRDKAVEWRDQVENYVREQPIKAVLMAAGVGVILGILWKRS